MNCPVCGHPDGACTGQVPTRQSMIITAEGTRQRVGPERVPRQRRGIGRAGYVGERSGKVDVYDPDAPNIRFVSDVEEAPEPATEGTAHGFVEGSALVQPVPVTPPKRPEPGGSPRGIGTPRKRTRKKADE